jgi:hypothetical protein
MEYGTKLYIVTWVWDFRRMGFHYRTDPVPRIGKNRNWKNRNWKISKKPKVMNEKRQWYKSDLGRTKRAPHYLPDSWETRSRTNFGVRSWKSNRKCRKQWKK